MAFLANGNNKQQQYKSLKSTAMGGGFKSFY